MLAPTAASIGAATLALAATAPLMGAAMPAFASRLTLTLSRLPLRAPAALAVVAPRSGVLPAGRTPPGRVEPSVVPAGTAAVAPAVAGSVVAGAAPAGEVVSVAGVAVPWSMPLSCTEGAVASPVMPWLIRVPWSARAWDSDPTERTLADAAASIGAATLAFAATPRSIGAAALIPR